MNHRFKVHNEREWIRTTTVDILSVLSPANWTTRPYSFYRKHPQQELRRLRRSNCKTNLFFIISTIIITIIVAITLWAINPRP